MTQKRHREPDRGSETTERFIGLRSLSFTFTSASTLRHAACCAGTRRHYQTHSEGLTKKRQDYLEWPEYFMAVAFLSAQRSKDPSSQLLLIKGHRPLIRSMYLCHAELNAIMNKNSADVKGCTMYVALFPCNECTKLIIQAGIKDVIYLSDKYHDTPEMTASRRLLNLAGITYK
ncbi:deoxycytidylate deaminase-like [Sinocyclocheilus rhinocerous]|uniref:deoxycytidylate deaminase-like n=1 Tax=Sinocyclocheilus rhinocerous TaxID=307959 RepID=UPI0007B8EABC|nr:PREDICTED: deoxycytidylate deaminase-like [Sinocyclocheilus rhinocerous]